jgi:hypothetical protein
LIFNSKESSDLAIFTFSGGGDVLADVFGLAQDPAKNDQRTVRQRATHFCCGMKFTLMFWTTLVDFSLSANVRWPVSPRHCMAPLFATAAAAANAAAAAAAGAGGSAAEWIAMGYK